MLLFTAIRSFDDDFLVIFSIFSEDPLECARERGTEKFLNPRTSQLQFHILSGVPVFVRHAGMARSTVLEKGKKDLYEKLPTQKLKALCHFKDDKK